MSRQALLRPRPAAAPFGALTALCFALVAGSGCKGDQPPPPTKVDETLRDAQKRPQIKPDPKGKGLSRPDLRAPEGPEGPQLADDKVEEAIKAGREALAAKEDTAAISHFRTCANREPASARCDGELALLLGGRDKRRRATARYFLLRAAANDDPKAGADLYARLGDALRKIGKYPEAAQAWSYAIAREDKAEHHRGRAHALVSNAETLAEAADELAKASSMSPNDEWVVEEASLRGQIQEEEQNQRAIALLEGVIKSTKDEALKKRAQESVRIIKQAMALRARRKELEARGPAPTEAPAPAEKEVPTPQ